MHCNPADIGIVYFVGCVWTERWHQVAGSMEFLSNHGLNSNSEQLPGWVAAFLMNRSLLTTVVHSGLKSKSRSTCAAPVWCPALSTKEQRTLVAWTLTHCEAV